MIYKDDENPNVTFVKFGYGDISYGPSLTEHDDGTNTLALWFFENGKTPSDILPHVVQSEFHKNNNESDDEYAERFNGQYGDKPTVILKIDYASQQDRDNVCDFLDDVIRQLKCAKVVVNDNLNSDDLNRFLDERDWRFPSV